MELFCFNHPSSSHDLVHNWHHTVFVEIKATHRDAKHKLRLKL